MEAAELVAFDVLNPVLRSRGTISEKAKQLYADENFKEEMRLLFTAESTGCLAIPTLQGALERIEELERRVATLENRLSRGQQNL